MKRFFSTVLLAALATAATHAAAAIAPIDNFDSYADARVLTTGGGTPPTYPWTRTGTVVDNLVTTKAAGELLDGTESAKIATKFTLAGQQQTLQFQNFSATPTDLGTTYTYASVKVKSLLPIASGSSTAQLQLSISDGSANNWVSTAANIKAVSNAATPQTLYFSLAASDLKNNGGSETLAQVLAHVTAIGFRISSTASTMNETLDFDTFQFTSVPEPVSLGFIGLCAVGVLRRRRRR